jgi:hypothetical protein
MTLHRAKSVSIPNQVSIVSGRCGERANLPGLPVRSPIVGVAVGVGQSPHGPQPVVARAQRR